jgi:hypothetical protein
MYKLQLTSYKLGYKYRSQSAKRSMCVETKSVGWRNMMRGKWRMAMPSSTVDILVPVGAAVKFSFPIELEKYSDFWYGGVAWSNDVD